MMQYTHTYTHAHDFLQPFALVLHAWVAWAVGERADSGEKAVEGRGRAPNAGRCARLSSGYEPEHLASVQPVLDRRADNKAAVLIGSLLFIHTPRVWQVLPAVWGPAFFPTSLVCVGFTTDHRAKPLPGNLEMSVP